MDAYEVAEPILNSPFAEPAEHWYIREGEEPQKRTGRRPAIVYPPRDERRQRHVEWSLADGTLAQHPDYPTGYEMKLVNLIRERVAAWRAQGYPGVTRTTFDLLSHWRREGREKRLFFAQVEAAETIIFLNEARADFRQGLAVPRDDPSDDRKAEGYAGFLRYACKMATGSGKTTVMGMLCAWSILNKVNDKSDGRFSDVVLIVCPNVTIRNRLAELDPAQGEASLYRTRDLVPPHLLPAMTQGRVLTMNWHMLAKQTLDVGGESAKVNKAGVEEPKRETIRIGQKTGRSHRNRYLTRPAFEALVATGELTVIPGTEKEEDGELVSVEVHSVRRVESDSAWLQRILGREVGDKRNILILNDEAHHAYRIKKAEKDSDEEELFGEEEEADEFFEEATVWIDGLDRIQKKAGINFCVDLSATPYFLGRVGQETNRPFPWVVSDFGLVDAIESGLVKIPQLAVRDTTGAEVAGYFNIWKWVYEQLTPRERGGKRTGPGPTAILKYADHPIRMLASLWEEEFKRWEAIPGEQRRPVFIIVCKTQKLAKSVFEWLALDECPTGIPSAKIKGFRNRDGEQNTIRVDTGVVHDTDTGHAKGDESRWMRLTLDSVGKRSWPVDSQGRPLYPDGFEELAAKLGRPLHPPGRDVRCIVSVGMLTEGWDCNTVTHIIGLRPFMSQLLCEQVVGRGLRRASYEVDAEGKLAEEVARVFGVPFEVIPFKANKQGPATPPAERFHVHPLPGRAALEIRFPRVDGYTQAIRNRVKVDWDTVPSLLLKPDEIPPEVQVKGMSVNNVGKLSLSGPGCENQVDLENFRANNRLQTLIFDSARALTKSYLAQQSCEVPAQVLFPQLTTIIERYLREKVRVVPPADVKDCFLSPYFGWLVEVLCEAIRPDQSQGEAPEVPLYESGRGEGSTVEVSLWTSRPVRPVTRSHLNYVVADTENWEQTAAYFIDTHPQVESFVKNAGLGFAIPYFHNGQSHDYLPDFIIRLKGGLHLILEVKGYDPLEEVKKAAAERWVAAVNADGKYGRWAYVIAKKPSEVRGKIDEQLGRQNDGE